MLNRLQLAAGTLIAGAAGYLNQLHLSSALHGLILLAAGALLLVLNPTSPSPQAALADYEPRPDSAITPDGAIPENA